MKIAYITAAEILGPQNTGGIQCCNRNLNLLKQAFGEENIYVCAITKHKEYLSKTSDNTKVFYSDRKKISILKNVLRGRLQFGKDVENAVLQHIEDMGCDVVFIEFSRMGFFQKRLPDKIKQVLFVHNIEIDYAQHLISEHPSYIVLKLAFKINEALALRHADIVMSLNHRDSEKLVQYYDRAPDVIIPITMDDSFVQSETDKQINTMSKLQLLFVGSLFPPNESGVTWFADEVMPYVNAEFTVVGRDFEQLRNRLENCHNNVRVIGTVGDLSQYYHDADVIVSPILMGAGMKVKTAEALMYGKPIFATDEALEGYEVEGQDNIYRCNTAQAFIEAINTYAVNPPFTSFDESIRNLFLEKYHTPRYIQVLKKLLIP